MFFLLGITGERGGEKCVRNALFEYKCKDKLSNSAKQYFLSTGET
jgi:hypothetical protein